MSSRNIEAWGGILELLDKGERVQVNSESGFSSTIRRSQPECTSVSLWTQIHSDMNSVLETSLWGAQPPSILHSPPALSPDESDEVRGEEPARKRCRVGNPSPSSPSPSPSPSLSLSPTPTPLVSPSSIPTLLTTQLPPSSSSPSSSSYTPLSKFKIPSNIHIITLDIQLSKKLPFISGPGASRQWTNKERERVKATVRKAETHEQLLEYVCAFIYFIQYFTELVSYF